MCSVSGECLIQRSFGDFHPHSCELSAPRFKNELKTSWILFFFPNSKTSKCVLSPPADEEIIIAEKVLGTLPTDK